MIKIVSHPSTPTFYHNTQEDEILVELYNFWSNPSNQIFEYFTLSQRENSIPFLVYTVYIAQKDFLSHTCDVIDGWQTMSIFSEGFTNV